MAESEVSHLNREWVCRKSPGRRILVAHFKSDLDEPESRKTVVRAAVLLNPYVREAVIPPRAIFLGKEGFREFAFGLQAVFFYVFTGQKVNQ